MPGLLAIALVASVCGAESCVDFAGFAEDLELLLREFLSLDNGLPRHDALTPTVRASGPCGLWAGLIGASERSGAGNEIMARGRFWKRCALMAFRSPQMRLAPPDRDGQEHSAVG